MGYVIIKCSYCGHKQEKYLYSADTRDVKCEHCKDSNVKIVPTSKDKNDIFGYEKK